MSLPFHPTIPTIYPVPHCVQNIRNPGIKKKKNLHLISGSLAESNTEPPGTQLTNPFKVTKYESTDLVELAREIQKVSI